MHGLTLDQSRAFGAHLANLYDAVIYSSETPQVVVVEALLQLLATRLGVSGRLPAGPEAMTWPTPVGTLILLSDTVLDPPDYYARTAAHEAQHAFKIKDLGGPRMAVDYLFSGELRVTREAHAYAVEWWVSYLLTGRIPTLDEMMGGLMGGLYLLNDKEIRLGRGILASGLAAIEAGAVPPYRTALDALRWLRANALDAIVPEAHRVAV